MMLTEETPVPQAALPVEEMKDHLRMGSGFADDALQDGLIETYLRAAMAAIEGRIGKMLYRRRFLWELDCWRDSAEQALPVSPVDAIVSVTLVDAEGIEVVVPASGYRLIPDLHRPRLLGKGISLPTIPPLGLVKVVFDAGFGAAWTDVPVDLRQAVLLLAGEFYEHRHDDGAQAAGLPFGVVTLIERWRNVRLLGGAGMNAPHLNRALGLEGAVRTPDGAGGFTEVWAALGMLWAEVLPGSGSDTLGEERMLSAVPYRITVRAAPVGLPSRPKAGQRLVEGTRLFLIQAVTERDPDGRYLTCFSREEVPK